MGGEPRETPREDAAKAQKRTPRSIRFHDPGWEGIESFAESRGLAAAEFVRFAALAAIGDEAAGTGPRGPLAPLIERTFRYAWMTASRMRGEMLAGGRGEELEALIANARADQDELLDKAPD